MTKRILVTGGTGFIETNLVEKNSMIIFGRQSAIGTKNILRLQEKLRSK